MKLIDALRNVDRSSSNTFDGYNWGEGINQAVGVSLTLDGNAVNARLKSHWLITWWGDDQIVGVRVYYLDDEPVAYSVQRGRKCDEDFTFVSPEAVERLRAFLMQCAEPDTDNLQYIDSDEEIDDTYTVVHYELMDYEGIVNGRCAVIDSEKFRQWKVSATKAGTYYGRDQQVEVTFDDGTAAMVPFNEFKIPLKVITK